MEFRQVQGDGAWLSPQHEDSLTTQAALALAHTATVWPSAYVYVCPGQVPPSLPQRDFHPRLCASAL